MSSQNCWTCFWDEARRITPEMTSDGEGFDEHICVFDDDELDVEVDEWIAVNVKARPFGLPERDAPPCPGHAPKEYAS